MTRFKVTWLFIYVSFAIGWAVGRHSGDSMLGYFIAAAVWFAVWIGASCFELGQAWQKRR